MQSNQDFSKEFITNLKEYEHLTITAIANMLNVHKSFISNIYNGKASLPQERLQQILKEHPDYAKYCTGQQVYSDNNIIKAIKLPDSKLTTTYKKRDRNKAETLYFDKRLLNGRYEFTLETHLEVATIASNLFDSSYRYNDNILIDTSVNEFVSGFIFAFVFDGDVRICEVRKQGDVYKCLDVNTDNPYNFEAKESECDVIGRVVPNIKF